MILFFLETEWKKNPARARRNILTIRGEYGLDFEESNPYAIYIYLLKWIGS